MAGSLLAAPTVVVVLVVLILLRSAKTKSSPPQPQEAAVGQPISGCEVALPTTPGSEQLDGLSHKRLGSDLWISPHD
jgi:hypothetical protein